MIKASRTNAAAATAAHAAQARALAALIQKKADELAAAAADGKADWGHAGTAGHLEEQLEDILLGFYGTDEDKAREQIAKEAAAS